MPNSYYNHGSYPTPNSPGSSGQLRSELDSITTGFSKLPTLSGNGNNIVRVNAAGTLLESIVSVPVSSGGTGLTSYTANGALYANGTGTALLTGTLPITSGGTGAITAVSARTNLLPTYAGNADKVLTVNPTETDVVYAFINTASLTGILPIAKGGTNASTAPGARTNLLPAYAGKAGYALVINGAESDVEFLPAPGIGIPLLPNAGGTGLTSPGAAGNLLTSTGTAWASLAPPITGPSTAKTYFMGQF